MPTLYVTEPGARIEKEYRRLVVTSADDERLLSVPLSQVSDVVLLGSVGVTTPALLALLEGGVGLSLISAAGKLRGRLQPVVSKNIPLRHLHYRRAEDRDFCLEVARAIVLGKLHNQRSQVRRLGREHPGIDCEAVQAITRSIGKARTCTNMDSLRGQEGCGARAYFHIFRQAFPGEWRSQKRSRRPPPDPLNALLSLGYSLLAQNMMTALELAGLDPYDGFYHADQYGRPALALDLEEEFRSVIVDPVVRTLINRRRLALSDFKPAPGGGVQLTQAGLRIFMHQYSAKLHSQVYHAWAGRRLSYLKCFEVQARLLRRVIEGQEADYLPFMVK